MTLLSVENLRVKFIAAADHALRGVSFSLNRGERVALVGESGSGKTVCALSILRLVADAVSRGRILLDGVDVGGATDEEIRRLRGSAAAMIFQEPMVSLNPLHTVGRQITETLRLKTALGKRELPQRTLQLLKMSGFGSGAAKIVDRWPHQLSGGQRQRAMIAMALAGKPKLLIADEPTSALDVSVQKQILTLLMELGERLGMAILFISHDLAVVKQVANRLLVMQKGKIVEESSTAAFFAGGVKHTYARRLAAAHPRRMRRRSLKAAEVLTARSLSVTHAVKGGWLRRTKSRIKAVRGVSFTLRRGRSLGVVGESGSGKTSLALGLLRLLPAEGAILFDGVNLASLSAAAMRGARKWLQVVFQDPFAALNPRFNVSQIIGEGLAVHEPQMGVNERRRRVAEALEKVGLAADYGERYPHEFSGGQRQRLAIARALVLRPKVMILDEPTSALDVSVQNRILKLLRSLQRDYGLAYLFISHDFAVVRAMVDEVMVLKGGRVLEHGTVEQVFTTPKVAYTKNLIAASPGLAYSPGLV